jgi:hypothetical protein
LGFGASGGHKVLKDLLELYEKISFINDDGSLNLTACPVYQTEVLTKYGVKLNNKYQNIDGVTIYPVEVFNPEDWKRIYKDFTEETHAIHHFDGSWLTPERRRKFTDGLNALRKYLQARGEKSEKPESQRNNPRL